MKISILVNIGRLMLPAFVLAAQTSRAVILFGSGDPTYNTTPPAGALTNSGWQYEGQWGGFLGTPIAPQYFMAAQHIGGSVGQTFTFNGVGHTTTAYWNDPNSDLRIWKVNGVFTNYAPLYSTNNETGKPLVVIGRGTQRGDPVTVTEAQTQTNSSGQRVTNTVAVLCGWQDGAADGVMRWGQNQVCYAVGTLLMAAFTGIGMSHCRSPAPALFSARNPQTENETGMIDGDLSGATFIQDNSDIWIQGNDPLTPVAAA